MKINFGNLTNKGFCDKGIVYILYISLEIDDKVHEITKVGVTTRKVEERVVQILTSIWKGTRIFPRCYVKRFRNVQNPYTFEEYFLADLRDRYKSTEDMKFDGRTECFYLNEEERTLLIDEYDKVTKNQEEFLSNNEKSL